jgi:6-phosphofructokinase 1
MRVKYLYKNLVSSRRSHVISAQPTSLVLECPSIRERLQPQDSPFKWNSNWGGGFVADDDKVSLRAILSSKSLEDIPGAEWTVRAGARETIYFDPLKVNAGIVTCGGLCPGLNDVIAGVVGKLHSYGVPESQVLGIRYGFGG